MSYGLPVDTASPLDFGGFVTPGHTRIASVSRVIPTISRVLAVKHVKITGYRFRAVPFSVVWIWRTLIERDGLKGVTSNPSIFEKAICETDEYAEALKQFQGQADHSISAIYEHLAIADIRAAADVLHPVHEQTQGRDGYISLECSPYLANDTEATVAEALRLWAAVDRPNLMVKVPATPPGIPAIRQLIGRGLNINITLLFAVSGLRASGRNIPCRARRSESVALRFERVRDAQRHVLAPWRRDDLHRYRQWRKRHRDGDDRQADE